MRSGAYEAWRIHDEEFPRSASSEEQLRFLVRYAVLAPSAHNTQPWTFRVEGNQVLLLPDFARALGVSDPTHRELYVSLGCALANLLLAAEHFGFRTTVEEFPVGEGEPVARVAVVPGGTESARTAELFAAIPRRHSNRGPYAPRPIPDGMLQQLRALPTDPSVRVDVVAQPETVRAVADLTARATVASLGRADFRGELSRWVRSNFTKRPDGMPGFAVGVPDVPSLLAPLMVRLPPMAKAEAKKARARIAGSPAVVVISSAEDAPAGWVKAGAAFERAWLAAVAAGLRASAYAGPVEVEAVRRDLERLLGITGARPQALLRIGYAPPDPHPTPRRAAREVMVRPPPADVPPTLIERLRPIPPVRRAPQPVFFNLSTAADAERLTRLLDERPQVRVIDTYEQQLKERFVLEKPWLNLDREKLEEEFPAYRAAQVGTRHPTQCGVWVYLPWRSVLLHLLPDADFQEVRTARNRNLIPADEQRRYYDSTIGIAGLSVGNSVALAIALMGGGKRMRLADPDALELTNLNRIRGSIADLTRPKVFQTAQQIYELDPYADLTLYPEGLTEENITEFFDGPPAPRSLKKGGVGPKLDVVVEEIDNLAMKLRMREEASRRRIPVVMATDNGDSGLVDIERYDLDADTQPFHGRLPEEIVARVRAGEKLPLPVVGRTIGEHLVGWDLVEPRMQQSLLEIGKTIPTWPQLGGAALLNGVAVAVAVRKILTDQPVTADRAVFSLSSALIPDYNAAEPVAARSKATEEFVAKLRAVA